MLRYASFALLCLAVGINFYFNQPPMPHSTSSSTRRTQFYLFGNPIQHSLSPTFHNTLFSTLSLPNHSYTLYESPTFSSSPSIVSLLKSPSFGGAAVTMPHKLDALSLMDSVGPEVDEIGSINTIVVLKGGKLEGRNTDVLGIRNALLSTLSPEPEEGEREKEKDDDSHPWGKEKSGLIIGGGGTTRAAIYALSKMGLSPIHLINRDSDETRSIIESFPQYELVALEEEEQWGVKEAEACQVVVGAIPSFEPETEGEKKVYRLAEKVFRMGQEVVKRGEGRQRRLLEMAYKPHKTRILALALSYNWLTIGGIEALNHQAFAQQHYWLLDERTETYLPELVAKKGEKLGEKEFETAAIEVRRKAGAL